MSKHTPPSLSIVFLALTLGCDHAMTVAAPSPAPGPAPRTAPTAPAGPQQTPPATQPTKPLATTAPEHAEYAALLAELITSDGLVRYPLLDQGGRDRRLQAVVDAMAAAPLPSDRGTRLAFWCNAYNANVIQMVWREAKKPGFTNVTGVPGFFDKRTITVAGEKITLNDLENTRIRPLGDPRIHAALVCAAMGCPPLRNEPYLAARLEEQFDDQCKRWVNDAAKFRVSGDGLGVSKILDWYGDDFTGPPYNGKAAFVRVFADPSGQLGRFLARNPQPKIVWLDYDWTLNRAQ